MMYAVLGASGNTGGVVARRLLAAGKQVRVISRSRERLAPLVDQGAEPVVFDSVEDVEAMTRAFDGAHAVYSMLPPNATNIRHERSGQVIAAAVEKANVAYVVHLSGIGAHMAEGAAHLSEFHHVEQAFNRIAGLNVLHLRPCFFMESLYSWIDQIKTEGWASGLLQPDLPVPRIASRDIGPVAADALERLDFEGHVERELLGHSDLSMSEAVRIVGQAISNDSLEYIQLSSEEGLKKQLQRGLSREIAELMVGMYEGFNNGTIDWLEARTPENSAPTSFEVFVAEEFVPRFNRHQPST